MSAITPGVQQVMTCATPAGICDEHGAGHELSAIRARAAAATPSKWRDAVVVSAESTGWISLELFETGERVRAWNHARLDASVVGSPVALHEVYAVLAVGASRLSVLVAPSA